MHARLWITLSLVVSTLALAPTAAADETCSKLPDRTAQAACYRATSGAPAPDTAGCNGGDKGYEACGAGRCSTEATPRQGETSSGCTEFVCRSPDWNNVTPEGGEDCLDMICRNVPPTIQLVQVTLAPHLTLLGGLVPGATVVRSIVLNAGFWCERGTGTGGPGNPCQRVLWTPAGSVGADPEGTVTTGGQTGNECSWAQSGVTGYNYVYDNGAEYSLVDGRCYARASVVVVMGRASETFHASDSCT